MWNNMTPLVRAAFVAAVVFIGGMLGAVLRSTFGGAPLSMNWALVGAAALGCAVVEYVGALLRGRGGR